MLILSGDVLEKLLVPSEVVEAVAEAFAAYSRGETVTPARTVMWVEGNWWGVMQSYVPGRGVGVKAVSVVSSNRARGLPTVNAAVLLMDHETGLPLALLNGTILTAARTAAACALSVKLMAPGSSGVMGIIGTGFQARYIVRYLTHVFKVEKLLLHDIDAVQARSFAEYARGLGIEDVVVCSNCEEVLRSSMIIVESTTSRKPVVLGRLLRPPVHVVSIGVTGPQNSTVDPETVARSEVVVVDSLRSVLEEVADIRIPLEKGLVDRERIVEIGEIVAGRKRGRVGEGVTLFKSVGVAVQDTAVASLAYRKAREKGVGLEVEL